MLVADVGKRFLRNLGRSGIVLDAASSYNETKAISEVSWIIVFRFIYKSEEGSTLNNHEFSLCCWVSRWRGKF